MGALSTPGAKVVMAGIPTHFGFIYDTHHSLRGRWHTMHVNCLDVSRRTGTSKTLRPSMATTRNAWRVRVLGEFPTETTRPLFLLSLSSQRWDATLARLSTFLYGAWTLPLRR